MFRNALEVPLTRFDVRRAVYREMARFHPEIEARDRDYDFAKSAQPSAESVANCVEGVSSIQ